MIKIIQSLCLHFKSDKGKDESKSNKQQLGQFFTTNYKYIAEYVHS